MTHPFAEKTPDTLRPFEVSAALADRLNAEETDGWVYRVAVFGGLTAVLVSDENGQPVGYL